MALLTCAGPLTDLADQLAAVLNHRHNGLLQLRGHGHVGRPLQAEEHHRERLVGEVGLLQVLLLQGAGRAPHDGREFPLEVLDHRLHEGLTVLPHLVGQPLVQIEVLPPGKARGIWSLNQSEFPSGHLTDLSRIRKPRFSELDKFWAQLDSYLA